MANFLAVATSPDLQVANVPFNVQKIKEQMEKYAQNGAKILLFPRLTLCGATCADLLFQPILIQKCLEGLKEIVDYSIGRDTLVVVGAPLSIGGRLYEVAVVFSAGKVVGVFPNGCLTTEDRRYFAPFGKEEKTLLLFGEKTPCGEGLLVDFCGQKITCVLGEPSDDLLAYGDFLKGKGADVILHLSSSPEGMGKPSLRAGFAKRMSAGGVDYLVSNPAWGESTSWAVYSGHKLYASNGAFYAQNKPFDKEDLAVDFSKAGEEVYLPLMRDDALSKLPFLPQFEEESNYELILNIQAYSLAKRLQHAHSKTAVIGVSGGLDSTLALLVLDRAFDVLAWDKKRIVAITMPGFGTTGRTFQNALSLIDAIGATSKTIDIKPSVLQHFEDIGHDKEVLDTTYENSQARMRTMILMDVANATGGIVVGTGDLSEATLGWCTYNGDHMSMYSVNATLPKTLIRAVVKWAANTADDRLKETLISVLETEVSPELLPPSKEGKIAQKTEELVGPYDLLDFFLYYTIKLSKSPKETYLLAKQAFDGLYDGETIKKWLKNFYWRFFTQQFKRSCSPDGVNVGTISFSPLNWRMPSDACAQIWLDEVEKL